MTDPNNAQRADWYRANHEATHTSNQAYGAGHRPTYAKVGAGWLAACSCGSDCPRVEDRMLYATWDDALDAAKTNLRLAEHGPSA